MPGCPIYFKHFHRPTLWWRTCTLISGEKHEPMKSKASLIVVVFALAGVAAAHKDHAAAHRDRVGAVVDAMQPVQTDESLNAPPEKAGEPAQ